MNKYLNFGGNLDHSLDTGIVFRIRHYIHNDSPDSGTSKTCLGGGLHCLSASSLLWELIDIILILQQNRLQWYRHVQWKEDTDWVKKCMEYEVEGSRQRGRPKRTWQEVVQKDCQPRNLNKEDVMDRGRWKKLIKNGWWSRWRVGECFFWHRLARVVPDKLP